MRIGVERGLPLLIERALVDRAVVIQLKKRKKGLEEPVLSRAIYKIGD